MKRMIDSSIWTNKKFCRLPFAARLLVAGIISTADDQGRSELTLRSERPTIRLIARGKREKWYENKLHKQYSDKRVRGEWFALTEDDVSHIANSFLESE